MELFYSQATFKWDAYFTGIPPLLVMNSRDPTSQRTNIIQRHADGWGLQYVPQPNQPWTNNTDDLDNPIGPPVFTASSRAAVEFSDSDGGGVVTAKGCQVEWGLFQDSTPGVVPSGRECIEGTVENYRYSGAVWQSQRAHERAADGFPSQDGEQGNAVRVLRTQS